MILKNNYQKDHRSLAEVRPSESAIMYLSSDTQKREQHRAREAAEEHDAGDPAKPRRADRHLLKVVRHSGRTDAFARAVRSLMQNSELIRQISKTRKAAKAC